jgi:hypothetical protein
MENFLFILNEQELTIIKNPLISKSLVARKSIGTFNPCNIAPEAAIFKGRLALLDTPNVHVR